jgi:hypothetical protein
VTLITSETVRGLIRSGKASCPVCGAAGHSCGPSFTGTPVDLPGPATDQGGGPMKVVDAVVNGYPTQIRVPESDPRPDVKKREPAAPAPVVPNKKRSTSSVRTK